MSALETLRGVLGVAVLSLFACEFANAGMTLFDPGVPSTNSAGSPSGSSGSKSVTQLYPTLSNAPASTPYTVLTYSPNVWRSDTALMDSMLGITGFQIEDFEDVHLLPGLSIQYRNPDHGPISTLLRTYDPTSTAPYVPQVWDGTHALVNDIDQFPEVNGPFDGCSDTYFLYQPGTRVFGVGISDFQSENVLTDLMINGTNYGRIDQLANYSNGSPFRNLYIKIIASESAPLITSVGFRPQDPNRPEWQYFDRVAISSSNAVVPEPASVIVFACLALVAGRRFLRREQTV